MITQNYFFTSESVSEGHPDKLCDQISDAVLDSILAKDNKARVACEAACANNLVIVFGEITTTAHDINYEEIVRDVFTNAGYTSPEYGVCADSLRIIKEISQQSVDIKQGVDNSLESREQSSEFETGAGDQGMMFGYATNETDSMMPLPIVLAHQIMHNLAKLRKNGTISYLRPDSKSQVTVEYSPDGKPLRVDTVIVSTQHDAEVARHTIEQDIVELLIKPILVDFNMLSESTRYIVNPSGRFVVGGPVGDAGLTGRKIIVDTYGGYARHGGGAFSGKDPTKVDRSGAYAARYVAKNIVASGIASKAEIQISYAIGVARPISIMVNTYNTGIVPDYKIAEIVKQVFDLRPQSIINHLQLCKPIYRQIAAYGHFGRNDLNLPWEDTDRADKIAECAKRV